MLNKYQIPSCFPNVMDIVTSWESCKNAVLICMCELRPKICIYNLNPSELMPLIPAPQFE